jgi:hypothetical protein
MGFAEDLGKVCANAGKKVEAVIRRTAIELQNGMIEKSPVGNPELWAANSNALSNRKNYNIAVDQLNADTRANPANLTVSGKLRKGLSQYLLKRQSKKSLKQAFPLVAGVGYVGGQFRANWQCGVGAVNMTIIDPPGSDAKGRTKVALETWKPGQTIWLTNALPYAKKLEDGYSKQAPFGMVKLTVNEVGEHLKTAARSIK